MANASWTFHVSVNMFVRSILGLYGVYLSLIACYRMGEKIIMGTKSFTMKWCIAHGRQKVHLMPSRRSGNWC